MVKIEAKILREVYDNNLKSTIRLRILENGQVIFTTTAHSVEDNNIKNLYRPILAQIRVTKECNLNCPYCYAENSLSNHDMSYAQLMQVLDLCNRHGIMAITWTGGEPLAKDFFLSLVKEAYSLGIRQTVLTNGTLLNSILEKKLPKENINFQISLNNVWDDNETNEMVLESAQRLFYAGYEVMLSIMLEPIPIKRYEKLLQKIISKNIPIAKFGLKIPVGAANQDDADMCKCQ